MCIVILGTDTSQGINVYHTRLLLSLRVKTLTYDTWPTCIKAGSWAQRRVVFKARHGNSSRVGLNDGVAQGSTP